MVARNHLLKCKKKKKKRNETMYDVMRGFV